MRGVGLEMGSHLEIFAFCGDEDVPVCVCVCVCN